MISQAVTPVRRIADSTVRRLSLYLRFLEESAQRGLVTISSDELARRGGTTSAQVRKDLSFFGSFGKRGLGYSVPELTESLREILGLRRDWQVIIVGAGKIGTALAQYRGFRQRGFHVAAVYDRDPKKVGTKWDSLTVRGMESIEQDIEKEKPDIVVLTTPAEEAQAVVDKLVRAGIRAVLNFAPIQLQVPPDVTLKNVNMAMELEGLSFALTNRDR
ncbi:MAG TPA: redox-sensing transcriptional repressor Rex [Gemmatimonadaceae bacterium]|nr:redox-sensing transcriptional repressor Rex [Gemmatimonadaceae bacterium]